jgi:hypothetical protein
MNLQLPGPIARLLGGLRGAECPPWLESDIPRSAQRLHLAQQLTGSVSIRGGMLPSC